jgi:hypothetical protein
MPPVNSTAVLIRLPVAQTTAWAGPVLCRHCTEHRQMATVSMLEDGEVTMSLRFRWPDGGNGEVIRATGFYPISAYLEDNPNFAWSHSCRRDDGPADLDRLASDAGNSRLRRRGYLIA